MSERASGTGPGRSVVALISGLFLGAGGLALGFALTALVAAVLVAGLGLEPSPALLMEAVMSVGRLLISLITSPRVLSLPWVRSTVEVTPSESVIVNFPEVTPSPLLS